MRRVAGGVPQANSMKNREGQRDLFFWRGWSEFTFLMTIVWRGVYLCRLYCRLLTLHLFPFFLHLELSTTIQARVTSIPASRLLPMAVVVLRASVSISKEPMNIPIFHIVRKLSHTHTPFSFCLIHHRTRKGKHDERSKWNVVKICIFVRGKSTNSHGKRIKKIIINHHGAVHFSSFVIHCMS